MKLPKLIKIKRGPFFLGALLGLVTLFRTITPTSAFYFPVLNWPQIPHMPPMNKTIPTMKPMPTLPPFPPFKFKGKPTPTLTPTTTPVETPTLTPSPIPTSTVTPTPSSTNTPTPTVTETPSPTGTETPTPTVTETPTPTATETPTITPTPTLTETPVPTVTQTPTPTVTETPTPTVTETPTITPTPTESLEITLTPTITITPTPTVIETLTPTATTVPTSQSVVINEIYYDPDPQHKINNNEANSEWVELYNPSNSTVSLSGWSFKDNTFCEDISGDPSVPSGGFALISPSNESDIRAIWPNIPVNVIFIKSSGPIGNGLASDDEFLLRNGKCPNEGNIVDHISWGSNTYGLNPSIPTVSEGHSSERNPDGKDTGSASDFIDQYPPTPGT